MSEMKHYTPSDKTKVFLENRYGKTYTDDKAACESSKYDELLFGLVGSVIKDVAEVIDKIAGKRLQRNISTKIYEADKDVNLQMLQREEKHGPCPTNLRVWLLRAAKDNIRLHVGIRLTYDVPPYLSIHPWIDPPPKDHALRTEYNKWMKRKPLKATKNSSNCS